MRSSLRRNSLIADALPLYRLGQLNDVKIQRERDCAQWEPEAWKAVLWLRKNRDKFKMPVHEPARLHIFPKTTDKLILSIVEGPISRNAFKVGSLFFLSTCADLTYLRSPRADVPFRVPRGL